MPVEKDKILRKFSEIISFTQYPSCFYGGYEALSVKLSKSDDLALLKAVQLAFPPFEPRGASRYPLLINMFWACVLPAHTPASHHIAQSTQIADRDGFYEERFGDLTVTLQKRGDLYILEADAHVPERVP